MTRVTSPLRRAALVAVLLATAVFVRAADTNPTQERADRFLALTNSTYQALSKIGGNINVESKYGEGTQFEITIPNRNDFDS